MSFTSQGLLNATQASPYSPMNFRHKALVHLPLLESFKAESGALTTSLRHTPTTQLGTLKHTTNLLQQQHTSKNQSNQRFPLNVVVLGVFLELPDDGGDHPFLNTTWVVEESLGEELGGGMPTSTARSWRIWLSQNIPSPAVVITS